MRGYVCERCGANLDPGERCECRDLRVLVLRADGAIEVSLTDGRLETLQAIVGGYIEHVSATKTLGLLVNEEGAILGLPPNAFFPPYLGNIIIVGEPADGEDDLRSLSETETEGLLALFAPTTTRRKEV